MKWTLRVRQQAMARVSDRYGFTITNKDRYINTFVINSTKIICI